MELEATSKGKKFPMDLARNCLPMRTVLAGRGMQVPLVCLFCGDFDETPVHLFSDCSVAANCWRVLGIETVVSDSDATSVLATSFFFQVLDRLKGDDRLAWCMSLWSIWSSRNQLVWNNTKDSAATFLVHGNQLLAEWQAAHSSILRPALSPPLHPAALSPSGAWNKPPAGFVKCNIDAAFDTGGNNVGIGMCLRDDCRNFIAAKMQSFVLVLEVYKGEELGLYLLWIGFANSTSKMSFLS